MISKIYFFINLLLIFIIIILLGFSTFLPQNKQLSIIYSPFLIVSLFIILILIILYPWIIYDKNKLHFRFIIRHIPFILLILTFILATITSKKIDVSLYEGKEILINNVYKKLNLNFKSKEKIKLINFEKKEYKNRKKIIKSYKSFVEIKNIHKKKNKVIEVNKPLKIDKITFYQNSWYLGINEILFSLNGKKYNIFDQKDNPIIVNKNKFILIPKNIINNIIIYEWKIYNQNNNLIDSGEFNNDKEIKSKLPKGKIDLLILKENFKLVSVLTVTYKPFNILLALSGVLFILSIFLIFGVII